jgi:uncharacterized repeat protein (TIGR03843 family)
VTELTPPVALPVQDALELLERGEITVQGRITTASNATLYCGVELAGVAAACVYKPVAGERPLWDFPDGTLAARERAAYVVSEATGWGIVPPTVLRDGPFGTGMCQLWIDPAAEEELIAVLGPDETPDGWHPVLEVVLEDGRPAVLAHRDDERLRRIAVFDAVINNADRKGGHLLADGAGRVYGVDHGVCFAAADKLRTLLWGWSGEPLTDEAVDVLQRLAKALGGELGEELGGLLTRAEVEATRRRVRRLLESGRHPVPGGRWPAVPWPPL